MKNGQVTIFIILAGIIVIGIISFFVIRSLTKDTIEKTEGEIKGEVESCLANSIKDAVFFNPLQGGYFLTPEPKVKFDYLEIPIYWDKGTKKVPDITELEKQIGIAIQVSISDCVGDFEEVRERGYDVEIGDIEKVNVYIKDKLIEADVFWSITIKKGDGVKEFSKFSNSLEFDFMKYWKIVLEGVRLQESLPNDIPIVEFSKLAYDNKFQFETIEMGDNTVVYNFKFDNDLVPKIKYIYAFASRYISKEV